MNKISDKAIKSLKQLREINDMRAKGYQKVVDLIKNGNSKNYFLIKINEINSVTEHINRSIEKATDYEIQSDKIEDEETIHQSQFYFTMAAATTNPRTVALSCQLGDKFTEKAYASALLAIQFLSLPELRNVLLKHVSSLQQSFETTREAFDLALVY